MEEIKKVFHYATEDGEARKSETRTYLRCTDEEFHDIRKSYEKVGMLPLIAQRDNGKVGFTYRSPSEFLVEGRETIRGVSCRVLFPSESTRGKQLIWTKRSETTDAT